MPSSRSRTPVLGAWLEGWRRVLKAPALSASLLVLTLAMAVPLGAALGGMIESHLGASTAAEGPAWNWDAGWAAEFAAQAQGLGRTFTHEIIGFGGTLKILSGILDGQSVNRTLAGAALAYAVLWLFLTGGIVDRLARGRVEPGAQHDGRACAITLPMSSVIKKRRRKISRHKYRKRLKRSRFKRR